MFIKSVWILANNKVQDQIGHKEFGMYSALFAFGFLFLALSDLGVNQFATKTFAKNPAKAQSMLPGFFSLKLILGILFPFLITFTGILLGYTYDELYYLFILCFIHSINQIVGFFRSNFQAAQKFKLDGFASVLDRTILLVVVLLLISKGVTLNSFVFASLFSSLSAMVILYFVMQREFGRIVPGGNIRGFRDILKQSMPFAILTVLYSLNDKIDQVMLERIAGKNETGLYAAAYRWVDAVMMYLWTVLPVFFARFSRFSDSKKDLKKLISLGQGLAAIPMIFCAVFVFFYGEKLFWQFKGSTTGELTTMIQCLKILFIAVLINGIFAIYSTQLTAIGKEMYVNVLIIISIALNVTLNIIFIPQFGALACAWNTVVSFSFLTCGYFIYFLLKKPEEIPWPNLLKTVISGLLFTGIFWALSQTQMEWYAVSVISGGALLFFSLIFGLFITDKEFD